MSSLRVLVCGSRKFRDRAPVFARLDELHRERGIALVIEGGAPGADAIANAWAKSRAVACLSVPADWSMGPKAGPLRNARMLAEGKPELVLAFPMVGAENKGTANMVGQARKAGVPVVEVGPPDGPPMVKLGASD